MIRLRHLVKMAPSSKEIKGLTINDDVTFAPMDTLNDGVGGIDASKKRTLGELLQASYNYFAEDDLLLAKVTPCFENGKKALAKDLINGIGFATSEVHIIRPNRNKIDPNYLLYVFCAEDFRAEALKSMTGSGGLRRVSENAILDYCTRVVDIQLQREIADFLDRETTRIDQLIEKKEQLIKTITDKEEIKIFDAVTKGIYDNNGIKATNFFWIGETPKHWKLMKLKRALKINNGKDYKKVESETGFPVIGSGGQFTYSRDYLYNGEAILLGRKGTIDKPIYIDGPFWTVDTMFYGIPQRGYFAKFIYYIARTIPYDFYQTDTALPSMTQAVLNNHTFSAPHYEEQKDIAIYLDRMLAKTELLKVVTNDSIELLKNFKSSLITEVVTGQLDITAWKKRGGTDKSLEHIAEAMTS